MLKVFECGDRIEGIPTGAKVTCTIKDGDVIDGIFLCENLGVIYIKKDEIIIPIPSKIISGLTEKVK